LLSELDRTASGTGEKYEVELRTELSKKENLEFFDTGNTAYPPNVKQQIMEAAMMKV